jgi:Methyltransferase domain
MVESSHKRVSIKERAFTVGGVVGINGYRVNKQTLKQRFAEEGGYQLHETPHFLLCTRAEAPKTVIIHWLAPEKVDADIGHYFMQELKPLGIFEQGPGFGDIFAAVLFSLSPYDIQRALRLYATNTLRRYRRLVMIEDGHTLRSSPMENFSLLYRRICDLQVGEQFLDAGCGYGFLPLLLAEHFPGLNKVVGLDIRGEHFPVIKTIAEERGLKNVYFIQADLLARDFATIGHFDTVTALHVLEHFTEGDMYQVLTNLLEVAAQRLILAVPYEEGEPERAYDHKQLFSQEKLEGVGRWCLEQWGGGSMRYEDSRDGLLVIERRA